MQNKNPNKHGNFCTLTSLFLCNLYRYLSHKIPLSIRDRSPNFFSPKPTTHPWGK